MPHVDPAQSLGVEFVNQFDVARHLLHRVSEKVGALEAPEVLVDDVRGQVRAAFPHLVLAFQELDRLVEELTEDAAHFRRRLFVAATQIEGVKRLAQCEGHAPLERRPLFRLARKLAHGQVALQLQHVLDDAQEDVGLAQPVVLVPGDHAVRPQPGHGLQRVR